MSSQSARDDRGRGTIAVHASEGGTGRATHLCQRTLSRAASVFSFETAFLLFLFAGLYKSDPALQWVPIDLTVLLFSVSVAVATFLLLRTRPRLGRGVLTTVVCALAFVAWLLISLAWTPGRDYASEKALRITTVTLWSLLGSAMIIGPDRHRLRRFAVSVLALSAVVAIEALVVYFRSDARSGFISVHGSNYLALGRVVGMGTLVAAWLWWLSAHRHRHAEAVLVALLALFDFVLLTSGGRGPLLASVAGLVAPILVSSRRGGHATSRKRYLYAAAIALGLGAGVATCLSAAGTPPTTLARLVVFVTKGGTSAAERASLYGFALRSLREAPVAGHGLGSWSFLTGLGDMRAYPHNILLEVITESGVIGLLLFLMLIAAGLRGLRLGRLWTDPQQVILLTLFVNAFANAMVSGDIPDNRVLFAVLGLMSAGGGSDRRREGDTPPQGLCFPDKTVTIGGSRARKGRTLHNSTQSA